MATVRRLVNLPVNTKPIVNYVVSQEMCSEHLCHLVEIRQNGIKVNTYCPRCQNELMRQEASGNRYE